MFLLLEVTATSVREPLAGQVHKKCKSVSGSRPHLGQSAEKSSEHFEAATLADGQGQDPGSEIPNVMIRLHRFILVDFGFFQEHDFDLIFVAPAVIHISFCPIIYASNVGGTKVEMGNVFYGFCGGLFKACTCMFLYYPVSTCIIYFLIPISITT